MCGDSYGSLSVTTPRWDIPRAPLAFCRLELSRSGRKLDIQMKATPTSSSTSTTCDLTNNDQAQHYPTDRRLSPNDRGPSIARRRAHRRRRRLLGKTTTTTTPHRRRRPQ
jgi:hypothetical protein